MTGAAGVAIGAGGTAGHVVPAIVVADALRERGLAADDVVFIGGHGLETDLVPAAGYRLHSLPVKGLRRPVWSPRNVVVAASLLGATMRAARILRRENVRSVFSIGGYAALPAALAAGLLRRRLVLFEPNVRAGVANRVCARLADVIAVPFAGFGRPLDDRAVVVGPLLRTAIADAPDPAPARAALGVPDGRLVVGVFGGSQGARRLNDAAIGWYDRWRARRDLCVVQVTGAGNIDSVKRDIAALRQDGDAVAWHLFGYLADMPSFYRACDVAVSRAGAGTVAELLASGTPAVLVPGAFAEGHQRENAAVAVDAGAAVMVLDADATSERLLPEVESLLGDEARRAAMRTAARAVIGDPRAGARRVADLITEEWR